MLGKLDCAGQSDPGRVRPANEDQFLIASLSKSMQVHQTSLGLDDQTRLFGPSQGRLLLVADGMGGHAAGKRASALAVDSISAYVLSTLPWFFRLGGDDEQHFQGELKQALAFCQDRLHDESARVPSEKGMGTTLTMAYLIWPRIYVVHVGDSRCYLRRGDRLWRITTDHTMAQKLVEKGVLTDPDDPRFCNLLWNVVGGGKEELVPEVYKGDLALGDTLLLCSDGLTRHVADEELARMLAEELPARETCQRLVDAANAGGGSDNITVVVAHFREAREGLAVARAEAAAAPVAPV